MKNILVTLGLLIGLAVLPACGKDPLADQKARCDKILYYDQKLFTLDRVYIRLYVRHAADMRDPVAWGDTFITPEGTAVIEILALEDYPVQIGMKDRIRMQNETVTHEVMHLVLSQLRVPDDVQDSIIEAIRPGVKGN